MDKLYKALYDQGKYTKSAEDFKTQFGSQEGQKKLYSALNKTGAYTRSFDDFNKQFFTAPIEAGKTNDFASVDPNAKSEKNNTGSKLDIGSSELPNEKNTWLENFVGEDVDAEDKLFGAVDIISDLYRSGKAGWAVGASVDESFDLFKSEGGMSEEDASALVKAGRNIEDYGSTNEQIAASTKMRELKKEGYSSMGAFISAYWENPSALASTMASSLSMMASSFYDSEEVRYSAAAGSGIGAATGAAGGAAIGSVFGGVGAIPGAAIGSKMGAVSGAMSGITAAMETGLTTAQLLEEQATDSGLEWSSMNDKQRIDYVMQLSADKTQFDELKNKALSRGLTIGGVDFVVNTATFGVGKLVSGAVSKSAASALTKPITGLAMGTTESVGSGFGEYLGQKAAGQEFNFEEIALEAISDKQITVISSVNNINKGNPSYKLNGEKMNGKRFSEQLKIMDDVAIVESRIEINNSPAVQKIVNNRRQNIAADQKVDSRISDITDRAEAIRLTKEKNSLEGNKEGNKSKLKKIDAELNIISEKYANSDVDATIQERQDAVATAVDTKFEAEFNKNYKALKDKQKDTGIEPVIFEDDNLFAETAASDLNVTKEYIVENAPEGVFVGKGKVYINKNQAKRSINIATGNNGAISVTSHEVLHPIFNALIGGVKTQGQFVKQFKKQMTSKQKAYVNKRIKSSYADNPNAEAIELMNIFSDGIIKNDLNYDQTAFEKLGDSITNLFRSAIGLKTNEISFEDGRGVFNFLKEYNTSVKAGKLSDKAISAIKEAETKKKTTVANAKTLGKTQFSISVEQAEADLQLAEDADPNDPSYLDNLEKAETALEKAEEAAKAPKPVAEPVAKKEVKPKAKVARPEKPTRTTDLGPRDPISKKIMNTYNEGMEGVSRPEYKASKPLPSRLEGKLVPMFEGYINTIVQQKFKQFDTEALEFQDALSILRAEVSSAIRTYNPAKNRDLAGYTKKIVQTRQSLMFKDANKEFASALDDAKGIVATNDEVSVDRSGAVERGQSTFDQLDIVDDNLIKEISTELEKEIRIRTQKGTLSESRKVTQKVKGKSYETLVPWIEDYVEKALFKKLSKKLGAIGQTKDPTTGEQKTRIPGPYIDFLNDKNTFDIITKALPIKTLKSNYSKLFKVTKIGREKTAEGNPIFKVEPTTPKAFLQYFLDAKFGTLLARQKQLFREILRPVAKEVVADYATPENISELKSIQELAPKTSIDITSDIALEAQLNNLESILDRYKGEEKSFDIIQFSKESLDNYSDSEVDIIRKASGISSTVPKDLVLLEAILQIIRDTISPTATKLKNKKKFLREKLGEDLFQKLENDFLYPLSDAYEIKKQNNEYGLGTAAEQAIWDVYNKLPNIKVLSSRPKGYSGDTKPDIIIQNKKTKKRYIIEVKADKNARLVTFGAKNYASSNPSITRLTENSTQSKSITEQIKKDSPANLLKKFLGKIDTYFKKNKLKLEKDNNGNIIIDKDILDILLDNVNLYSASVVFFKPTNEAVINEIYRSKDVSVLSFLDIGNFNIEGVESMYNLPVFKADIKLRGYLKKYDIVNTNKVKLIFKIIAEKANAATMDALAVASTTSATSTISIEKSTKQFSKSDISAESSQVDLNKIGLESDSNHGSLLRIQFSKSARKKYENVLRNKRPELKDIPAQVDELFKWADGLEVADNKKSKYKKLALYYTANGYTIFPEDGYKIEEAIRLSEANKVDPYAYKNPDELINKFTKEEKTKKINPDTVKEFSNKRSLPEGVTIYDVNDSKAGQRAVRSVVDSNWGKEANPWCLIARSPKGEDYIAVQQAYSIDELNDIMATESALGNRVEIEDNYTEDNGEEVWELIVYGPSDGDGMSNAWEMWKNYNEGGYGYEIAFQNGKLLSFRDGGNKIFDDDGSEYYDTGEVELNWWDRFDKPTDTLQINLGKKNGLTTRGEIYFNEAQPQGEVELVGYGEGDFMSRKDTYKLYDENKELIEAKVYKDSKLSLAVENTPTKMNDGGRAINSKKSKYIDGELISSVTTVKDLKTGKIVTTTTFSHEKLNENSYIETYTEVGKNGKSPTAPKVTEKNIVLVDTTPGISKSTEYYAETITDGVSDVVIDRMVELNNIKKSLNEVLQFSKSEGSSINIYHGGDIKKIDDINGIVYFSEDKAQAAEYAKGNEGEVAEFKIKESDIVSEDVIYNEIDELGLKARGGFEVDELNLYELIDPAFETSLSKPDLAKLFKSLNKKGIKAVRFTDMNLKSLKNDISNIAVFDKKSIIDQTEALQFSKNLDKEFNDIIEESTGIESGKTIYEAASKNIGRTKGRFKFFIPPSAEDFVGLMYKLLSKGKKGEKQQAWLKKALFDPYAEAMRDFESYKQNATGIVKQLTKSLKKIPSSLTKNNSTGFTNEQAIRVFIWSKKGYDIPGLSKQEAKDLIAVVKNDPKLLSFADEIESSLNGYPEPSNSWYSGTITTDAVNMINTTKRAEFLKEWQANSDIIFSKDNINKLRSEFGINYSEALEDMLYRMKTGRNRPTGDNKLTNIFMNWINDSVGTIMFFNSRSALLQTLSIVNFVNWSDNNPVKAAKAFSNQKQFWKDFSMLFNSDFLKQRRSGLKNDINADDIARSAETSRNKARAVLSTILKAGFLPTQIADSFAIAMGGASFIRNRTDSYISDGMSKKEAETKAFLDFQEIAEETQQSSRPDRVSQQQASPLGRIILAFANTPMQYMRLTKKAFLDLKNNRGDWKTNVSKIVYYTAIQNVIFSSLQAAMFASLFEDDDEEAIKDKQLRTANSMLDSVLRGVGVYGAIGSTLKNIYLEVNKQSNKDRPDYTQAALKALTISPPVDSKMRKIISASRAFSYKTTRDKMKGFGLDNPAYYAGGQVVSAAVNVPVDRVIRKIENVRSAFSNETEYWQKAALIFGYSKWDLGLIKDESKSGTWRSRTSKNKTYKTSKWKKRQ